MLPAPDTNTGAPIARVTRFLQTNADLLIPGYKFVALAPLVLVSSAYHNHKPK